MPHFRLFRLFSLLLVIASVFAVACSPSDSNQSAQRESGESFQIVTTIGMIEDVTREIVGDRADVVSLMGPGVDPHLYKPTRSDVARIMEADIVLYNGLLLEGKMINSIEQANAAGKRVMAVTGVLDASMLIEPEEFEEHYDPHVWMDPAAWRRVVEGIRDTLSDFDEENRSVYEQQTAAYDQKLAELDAYCQRVLGSVPQEQRVLVTAHDAFGYFGHRFGYEVVGIQGLSTESEAGVRDIERIVNMLVERGIKAVFVESTVSERNINALISGARARGHEVRIGGELFSDAMGEAGTYEGTYIGMIDHNVTTIARALGGEAPKLGMNGRLGQ